MTMSVTSILTFAIETTDLTSNYAKTVSEYNKYQIGDVVTFDNGMDFIVWSKKIIQDEYNVNDYYVHTEYVEYIPGQVVDYSCEYILDSVARSTTGITSYFAATNSHHYTYPEKTVAATILTRFMYDGSNYPSVYAAEYRFSDSVLSFLKWDTSSNFFNKSFTNILRYNQLSGLGNTERSVSVTCKKDGTQG